MGNTAIGNAFIKIREGNESTPPEDTEQEEARFEVESGFGPGQMTGPELAHRQRRSEETDRIVDTRRNLVDSFFFEGLQMSYVNAQTISVTSGALGLDKEIFDTSAFEISVDPEFVDATAKWLYLHVAIARDKPQKPFFARTRVVNTFPPGYGKSHYIGVINYTASDVIHPFVQCASSEERHYSFEGILVDSTVVGVMTEITLDIPDGVCRFDWFFRATGSGPSSTIAYYAAPSVLNAPTPTLSAGNQIFSSGPSTGFRGAFHMSVSRKKIYHAATATGAQTIINLELYVRGFTDHVND